MVKATVPPYVQKPSLVVDSPLSTETCLSLRRAIVYSITCALPLLCAAFSLSHVQHPPVTVGEMTRLAMETSI